MKRVVPLMSVVMLLGAIPAHGQALPEKKAGPTVEQSSDVQHGARLTRDLPSASEPTFGPDTAARLKEAIRTYSAIAAAGGWPALPKDAKFTPGTPGASDALLRKRLIVTGDLAADKASGPFDDTLQAAVRHFQARHGLPQTGTVGPKTLAALNVPVEQRKRQLEASLLRTSAIGFKFGPRYVVVNIPAATIEAVNDGMVEQRHTAVVGRVDCATPIMASKISQINFNPYSPNALSNWFFEPLYIINDYSCEEIPWLAQSYEWRDDQTLVFTARDGVTWHDGEAFGADDIAVSLNLLKE